MHKKISITQARYSFNEIAKEVFESGEGVIVYKKNKPYAGIITAEEYLLLEAIKDKGRKQITQVSTQKDDPLPTSDLSWNDIESLVKETKKQQDLDKKNLLEKIQGFLSSN